MEVYGTLSRELCNCYVLYFLFLIQYNGTSVQFILTSNGNTSFAIFNYEEYQNKEEQYLVGFDAGNQTTYIRVNTSETVVAFRIDG